MIFGLEIEAAMSRWEDEFDKDLELIGKVKGLDIAPARKTKVRNN